MRAGVRPGLQILWVCLRWTGRFDSDSLPPEIGRGRGVAQPPFEIFLVTNQRPVPSMKTMALAPPGEGREPIRLPTANGPERSEGAQSGLREPGEAFQADIFESGSEPMYIAYYTPSRPAWPKAVWNDRYAAAIRASRTASTNFRALDVITSRLASRRAFASTSSPPAATAAAPALMNSGVVSRLTPPVGTKSI
jgi:hypothetical protein